MSRDTTCRYCGYSFETEGDLEGHTPCGENVTDTDPKVTERVERGVAR